MAQGLLVVTRYKDECIRITTPQGETLDVMIVQVKGRQVRVGIKCEKTFKVSRTQDLHGTEDARKVRTPDDWTVSKNPKVDVGEKFEAVFRFYEPSKGIPDSEPMPAMLVEDGVKYYDDGWHKVSYNWFIHKWRKIPTVQPETSHVV